MKRKFLTVLISVLTFLCCVLGLASCDVGNLSTPKDTIDYTKYEYYGEYSDSVAVSSGIIEMDLTLGENNQYTLEFRMTTYSAVYFLTEVGRYEMKKLSEPIKDEKIEAIYFIVFNPIGTTGYDGDIVNTGMGYITQKHFANFWWYYADTVQKGATVIWGTSEVAYAMTYQKLRYTVTYLAETGGSISGMTTQKIEKGGDGFEVTAVPDYGYSFSHWSDGVTTATRKETQVTKHQEYTAIFVESLPKYTLTYTATEGGQVEGEVSQTVYEGLDGTMVRAVLGYDLRYEFVGWSDGVTTAERTDLNVQQDINVTAIFKPQFTYYATIGEGGGSVEMSSTIANYANEYTVSATAIPYEGWAFVEWSDGVKTATRTDVLTENTKVWAIFAKVVKLIAMPGGKISYNGETGTEITVLLREPLIGELPPYAEAIADEGYVVCGWSKYEDASWWDSYNMYLQLEYYSAKRTYYAFFEKVEE